MTVRMSVKNIVYCFIAFAKTVFRIVYYSCRHRDFWMLRNLPQSVIFNFSHLPLRQASMLPVLLRKPGFCRLRGCVILNCDYKDIYTGMIVLGRLILGVLDDKGISISNHGKIVFNGRCWIGSGCNFVVNAGAVLEFGRNTWISGDTKIVCYHNIIIDDEVSIGWNCQFMDTDLHQLDTPDHKNRPDAFGKVLISHNCWIANSVSVYKKTTLPPYSVVGAHSVCNKDYSEYPEMSVFSGIPARFRKSGLFRNKKDNGKI